MQITDIPKNECLSCGASVIRIKVFSLVEGEKDILEYKMNYNCLKCRRLYQKKKLIEEQMKILQEKHLNIEWELFERKMI